MKVTEDKSNLEQSLPEQQKEAAQQQPVGAQNHSSGKKKRRWIIALSVTAVLLVSVLVLVYLGGAWYFKQYFLPGTTVNGLVVDRMTPQEAAVLLERRYVESYSLVLVDRDGGEAAVVSPEDVDMTFVDSEEVAELLDAQNIYAWPLCFLGKSAAAYEVSPAAQYDRDALQNTLRQAGLFEASAGEEPQDAYISEYLEAEKRYEIIPEKEGTLLIEEQTMIAAEEAIAGMEEVLDLEAAGCYEQPEITSDDAQLQERLAALNKLVGACITYDWNGAEEIVDGDLIHSWLVFDGDDILLDEEQIAEYVAEKAKQYDTYGKKRNFVTTMGTELTLPSGAYGWKTDREAETAALAELIMEGAVTDREPEYSSRGWVKGPVDVGNSYVEVNLSGQHLYLYENGSLVLETDFVSGNMSNGNGTPAGVFGITYKTTNAVLRGDDYETPVNYWMPFNGNIGMHDATWRRSFGGDIYLTGGSHGCINLPLDMAAAIYGYMSKGFPVICYY